VALGAHPKKDTFAPQTTATMKPLFKRSLAIILHAVISVLLVVWVMQYELTGTWIKVSGFVSLIVLLALFLALHVIFYFMKPRN